MVETNFQIGNLHITVQTPLEMKWTDAVRQFQEIEPADGMEKASVQVSFPKEIQPIYGRILHQDGQNLIMEVDSREYDIHLLPRSGQPFAVTEHVSETCLNLLIEERYLPYLGWNRTMLGFFALEHLSLNCNQFLLHASYVIHEGEAIVFTAPSGIGKSTQADLWARYEGAEIINGDRVLLMRQYDRWYAGGFPICGSSQFCLNKSAPVKAVICLNKSPQNAIQKLKPAEAFRNLYSQSFVNRWNHNDCLKISELLNSLCEEIPIYLYACTKEKSAVVYLKEVIFNRRL